MEFPKVDCLVDSTQELNWNFDSGVMENILQGWSYLAGEFGSFDLDFNLRI